MTNSECDWAQEALFDDQLDTADAERLRTHLASCVPCQQALAWDKRLGQLKSLPPVDVQVAVAKTMRARGMIGATVFATAAVLFVVPLLSFLWYLRPGAERVPEVVRPVIPHEFIAAAASPPVARLEILTSQSDALLAAIDQWQKELRK